ncbi:urease accessory protein UreF [Nocardia higoensis]|uniref:urease accessory protein UreF n=1 Tax=Nocardia higoensis TaxID=228599 RepID=UPI0012F67A5D|nr:urease accessory UreF family protein [Nocardia higoensis]
MFTIDDPAATLALLQLHDSGYPAGRFVHSNGLESWLGAHPAARENELAEVGRSFVLDTVAGLDAVAMAHVWRRDGLEELLELDRYVSAHKLSASARTASASCGRQAAMVAQRCLFGDDEPEFLRAVRQGATPGNQAIVDGVVHRALGIACAPAVLCFLRSAYAGLLSAAVRLGRAGPLWVQRQLRADSRFLAEATGLALTTELDNVVTFAPELDIHAMRHEQAGSRLFTT